MAESSLGIPPGEYTLDLGESLLKKDKNTSKRKYHKIQYDFKPASAAGCETYVAFGEKNDVTVVVPTDARGHGEPNQLTIFKGPSMDTKEKECVLIFDRDTKTFTLELLSSNIKVKRTRGEDSSQPILKAQIAALRKKHTSERLDDAGAPCDKPAAAAGDKSSDSSDSSSDSGSDSDSDSDGGDKAKAGGKPAAAVAQPEQPQEQHANDDMEFEDVPAAAEVVQQQPQPQRAEVKPAAAFQPPPTCNVADDLALSDESDD